MCSCYYPQCQWDIKVHHLPLDTHSHLHCLFPSGQHSLTSYHHSTTAVCHSIQCKVKPGLATRNSLLIHSCWLPHGPLYCMYILACTHIMLSLSLSLSLSIKHTHTSSSFCLTATNSFSLSPSVCSNFSFVFTSVRAVWREIERERERESEREMCVCVCVCVCERERERERES